ncbi:SDR family NAD(P)-dependent oxidoreductase [Leptolyngbyaceae cyanobacterium CCMR0082]|uniref:SDR family NAD(P)-dependent oxidoreductase n=1 Tax=Adonisia turfae CCMR0082 TaxID=2304604 RepID=A0A6M0SBL3_9CYAN|nr:SDR family NAD(P)-dependent oxidoreductase [Adonisia turfae]NEZ65371.1 SDR family NAD(P)-dependent oxidoreductase [Adonisia turfae CCMR0082]
MQAETERLEWIRTWIKARKAVTQPPASVTATDDAVVVTGVSGYFPGCMNVASFFNHIDHDQPLITAISDHRLDLMIHQGGDQLGFMRRQQGGFIPDIVSFDAELFGILPIEADEMDPRQRLLLMSTWRTLEDASINTESLKKSATGVFVGCESNEYAQLMAQHGFVPTMGLSQADSMMANRISYHFDFAGPSEMVNATCAGFAVALHRAFTAVRLGLIERAIVGAANLILLPDPFRILSEAGQLTAGSSVKSFGHGADGFLRAEGVGTILIERLSDAEAAGRSVYAVIKNASVNFNGQGGFSMAAPNIEAHAELIKACYREADIDPRRVAYVEAQGMGLPVADIAEWNAINRALTQLCDEKGLAYEPGFCRVSTLKPLVGHMHAASSLGALLKIIRSFQTNKIHKIPGFEQANEFCDNEAMPCRFTRETELWEQSSEPRLAALHSYGSGGNNAHVLLEDYQGAWQTTADRQQNFKGRPFELKRHWFPAIAKPLLTDIAPGDLKEKILAVMLEALGQKNKASTIDVPFAELGVDSLSIGSLVSKLETTFDVSIRKSDLFSYSTPDRLATHVATLRHSSNGGVSVKSRPAKTLPDLKDKAATDGQADDDIAVIGMHLRVAGAEDHADFWQLLKEGQCAITQLPVARANGATDGPDIRGGFLPSIDTFDPLFFNIAPRECEAMDPRHRLLLEAAWSAIEDAGYNPEDWKGKNHGIFIGIEESDYPVSMASQITAIHGGTAPARIGYFLDTKGPLLAISTACSSSLVAVHYACKSILDGESDCALVGGCNIICQPERTHAALSQMGNMLSPDGTCYAFDHRANGMVIGEGLGLVVLKRLSQARRDGDSIYAVIKGSGINYDGRTNGLTAPSGERQRELYERVQRQSGVRPEQIAYVVTHGTGTTLGDPIEYHALLDAFGANGEHPPYCALTSPKTNIGHTQAASGIVNLITATLALHHRAIPPSLNFEAVNPDIDLDHGPFYVNTALQAWDAEHRFAAVSSFGHTGTNAHVVLSDSGEPLVQSADDEQQPLMIVLSAQGEDQLRQAAERLLHYPVGRLQDLAYTLQVGRQAMAVRLGFLARSQAELRSQLTAFLNGTVDETQVFYGEASESDAVLGALVDDEDIGQWVRHCLEAGQYSKLLKMWVGGVAVDWHRLYGQEKPRRVHLPTYPFEKEHFWLDVTAPDSTLAALPTPAPAKPSASNVAEEAPHEILLFEETWQPAALVRETVSKPKKPKTAVCVLGNAPEQRAVADVLQSLATDSHWQLIQDNGAGALEKAFKQIREEFGSPDALFDLRTIGNPAGLYNPAHIVPLIQALAKAALNPARVLIMCPFHSDLQRCYADAWVGCEKSLGMILPKTLVVVVGMRIAEPSLAVEQCAQALHDEWHATVAESVLYEGEQRLAARLQPVNLPEHTVPPQEPTVPPQEAALPLKPGGTYLITGGGGGLGLQLATHLAHKHQANLVLTGRSELTPEKRSQLYALIKQGGGVMYLQADVSDANAMTLAVAQAKERFGTINGVIHAAGVESTHTILDMEMTDFQRVTAPKINGTRVLDQVLQHEPLDFMVYFSSSAAILGDFGAGNYAMGNRFQMAFARHRHQLVAQGQRQGKTVAINWPVWAQGGMGAGNREQMDFYLKTSGQRALETQEGFDLFEQLLAQPGPQHLVLVGKRHRVWRFLNLAGTTPDTASERPVEPALGRGRKPEMKGFSVEDCVLWDLRELVGALLKIKRDRLKATANFADLGFDSISLAEFAEALTRHFDIEITPALFFGHSTLNKLCQYFMDEHHQAVHGFYAQAPQTEVKPQTPVHRLTTAAVVQTSVPQPPDRYPGEPIAIIGMSGRFPQARNIDTLWEILATGRDAIEEVPTERFDWRQYYGDPQADSRKTNGKWGGFIPGVAEFDPLFFEISPREAAAMDPRQRLLLQEAWNALEDAGCGPRHLQNHKVGLFVGAEEGDYVFLAGDGQITANHNGILASRLAYFLDLRGPAMAINTACSSGLVAAHQACVSLRGGECDMALVAGVNLLLTPAGLVAMGQSGMLSDDGKCFVFDRRANGMTPGEAVVAMVLKPLAKAEADGDPIYGTIRASGVNYDGKTNGITAPSGVAQTELLRDVYSKAHIRPGDVDYIVTHGTGTKLGDPVEINALYDAFKGTSENHGHCALTSTKSNFGHTFAASGLLSAVSLVKAFQNDLIPASLHCHTENDYIHWDESPFFVNKTARPWPRHHTRERLGGVSAFGMSGTNAHMVFAEYCETTYSPSQVSPYHLLVLSAKTSVALKARVRSLIQVLQMEATAEAGLDRISCTLWEGRHHFRYRLAVVVADYDDAVAAWTAALNGEPHPQVFQGLVPPDFKGQTVIRKHAEDLMGQCRDRTIEDYGDALRALADYYCQGYQLDGALLWGMPLPPRLHLPTYPFERNHYWVSDGSTSPVRLADRPVVRPAIRPAVHQLHPLVHRNTSNFSQQQFRSMFTGQEPFLADHVVHGQTVLPGVGILEMARSAFEQSVAHRDPQSGYQSGYQLQNVVWLRPLVIPTGGLEVELALTEQDDGINFECRTDGAMPVIHATGRVSMLATLPPSPLDIPAIKQRMQGGQLSAQQCYQTFASSGLNYGPFYQGLQELLIGDEETFGRIDLPEVATVGADAFVLHPSLMDTAFQSMLGLQSFVHGQGSHGSSPPLVPFAIERLSVFAVCPFPSWVWTRRSPENMTNSGVIKLDIDVCDGDGHVAVRIEGFSVRAFARAVGDRYVRRLTGKEFFLKDHGGLLPGVVSLEWAQVAGTLMGPVTGLKQIVWSDLIRLDGSPRDVCTSLEHQDGTVLYRVSADDRVHAQGKIATEEFAGPIPHITLDEIRERCGERLVPSECDRRLAADLGPSFRSLVDFRHNQVEALATLELPACVRDDFQDYRLHPSMMNGAVQAANLLSLIRRPGGPPVPFSVDALWIHGDLPEQAFAHVTQVVEDDANGHSDRAMKYDIAIADGQGQVVVSMQGYCAIPATQPSNAAPIDIPADIPADILYGVLDWRPQAMAASDGPEPQRPSAAPVFLLNGDTAHWQSSLQAQWPGARFIQLSSISDPAEAAQSSVLEVLQLIQAALGQASDRIQPVMLAVPDGAFSPMHAALAGLFRTVRLEQGDVDVRICHLPAAVQCPLDDRWIRILATELSHPFGDVETFYDAEATRFVASLAEIVPATLAPAYEISPGDVIWITGGLGGVGLQLARHLAVTRQARVVLSGRSPLSQHKRQVLDSLTQAGATVRYLQCNVADRADVEKSLASILETESVLNGIVHCAGVIEDAHLLKKSTQEAVRVMQPKIAGTLALDEVTRDIPLDFMVLFSSLTGTFGNPGQADYAAANGFMDLFARERNLRVRAGHRCGRTVSIGWPLWRDGGMQLDAEHTTLLHQNSGLTPMDTARGITVFERCLQSDRDHLLVLHGEGAAIRAKLFAETEPTARAAVATGTVSVEQMLQALTAMVADQQKVPLDRIEPDVELPQYGFDSLAFTEFANRLNRRFQLDLMPTLFFEKSSLRSLVKHLLERYPETLAAQLVPQPAPDMPAKVLAKPPESTSRFRSAPKETVAAPINRANGRTHGRTHGPMAEPPMNSPTPDIENVSQETTIAMAQPPSPGQPDPIAIIGISGRFPGAKDVDELWRHLEANHDLISDVPVERWDWQKYYGDPLEQRGKTKVKCAGFMEDVDQFDPAFFGISPREAIGMDPQLRLLMETVWSAVEDAGYRASEFSGRPVGVFMGVSTSDYKDAWLQHAASDQELDGPLLVSHFVVANRISYALDLHGPSEPIDTACSSSLIAIHRAIGAMRMGHCESALVGGVNLILTPNITIAASRAGVLSEDGRCKTFDKSADGYGRGEGVAALWLKPLDQALADGDHIYCLIRSSAENHGGKAASPTAPNPVAQQALLVDAYTRAGIDPSTVGYIEAHGTGTAMGDAVEIDGLKAAFAELYQRQGINVGEPHCGLGSVKANIGHLEAAAGMAGVIKVIQMLRYQKIPGNPHLKEPNPYLGLQKTPFYLADKTQNWPAPRDAHGQELPRRAGVSSFGIGGANAHVVLEAYGHGQPATAGPEPPADHPQVMVLSARNMSCLKGYAEKLLAFLTQTAGSKSSRLRNVAWTLQTGREAMAERLGFVAADLNETVEKLTSFLAGEKAETYYHSRVHRGGANRQPGPEDTPESWLAAWMEGADPDWSQLHGDITPERISLPTYPFDRKRFWFAKKNEGGNKSAADNGVQPLTQLQDITLSPPSSETVFSQNLPSIVKTELSEVAQPSVNPQLKLASPSGSIESIVDVLVDMLAEILYMGVSDVSTDESFTNMGLDSVIGVEWIQAVNRRFDVKIPATKVYDYPNILAFANFLADTLEQQSPPQNQEKESAPAKSTSLDEVLQHVQRGELEVSEAERLIEKLDLAALELVKP